MLVHFFVGKSGKVQHLTGMQHGVSESGGFGLGESAQHACHEPGGHLIVGNLVTSVSADEVFDFRGGEFKAVSFLANDVNGADGR